MARPDPRAIPPEAFYGQPWAILPERFEDMRSRAEAVDQTSIRVAAASPGDRAERPPYRLTGGVAVIDLHGVMEKRPSLWGELFGDASTLAVESALSAALADPAASAVVLHVDSPGGSVDGTQALAAAVRAARQRDGGAKPIVAFADGTMASAAYWVGSAADWVVAEPTAQVGSIGVRMAHMDYSQQLADRGVKPTEIFAGRYKTAGSPYVPLDEASREYFQSRVDQYYTLFVEGVAGNRGVSQAQALRWADGRVLIGAEAQAAGLVDEVGTIETAISRAREKGRPMNRETLRASHPEVYDAILTEGAAGVALPDTAALVAEAREAGRAEALASERARCQSLVEVRGPVDLTLAAIETGAEAGAFAFQVLAAEREGRHAALDSLPASLAPAVPAAGRQKGPTGAGEVVDFLAAARARSAEKGIKLAAAIREVRAENPDLAEAWSEACCRQVSRAPAT